jgi:hypothetical protein
MFARYSQPVMVVANKIDINYEVVKKEFLFASKRDVRAFFYVFRVCVCVCVCVCVVLLF